MGFQETYSVSKGIVNVPGWISDTKGEVISGGGRTINVANMTVTTSGTSTYTPTIDRISVSTGTDAAAGAATTTPVASGVYVAVKSSAATGSVRATSSVISEGYVDSSHPGNL